MAGEYPNTYKGAADYAWDALINPNRRKEQAAAQAEATRRHMIESNMLGKNPYAPAAPGAPAVSPQMMTQMANWLRTKQPPPPGRMPAAVPPPAAPVNPALLGQLRNGGGPGAPPQGVAPPAGPPAGAGGQGTVGPPDPMQGPPDPTPPAPPPSPDLLDQVTPEMAQELMSLGDKERQLALAEKMRDQDTARGRSVNQGRTYVAASPLEHAATAYQMYRGGKEAKKIGEESTASRVKILDLLRKTK